LDNFAQVSVHEEDGQNAEPYLAQCAEVISAQNLPARSWYDLAHQLTRCAYFEQLEDWERIVALYDGLAQLLPSPVVELNRAVAVGMAFRQKYLPASSSHSKND
jgi:hypothetical protein